MSYKELSQDIKNNTLKPVYLIYGDEHYLTEHLMQILHKTYVNPAYEEFNYTVIDAEAETADTMFNALETLPFFEERKFIIIRNTPYFKAQGNPLSDYENERLINYLSNPYGSNCVFFITEANVDKRKKTTKTLQKTGSLVDMKKLDSREFEKWITKKIKSYSKSITITDLRYLVQNLGYLEKHSDKKLYDIDNELRKLISTLGSKDAVERADIDLVIEKPVENNIFLMVDATAEKNAKLAFQVLNQLLLNGEAEVKILFMITRHFKILNRVKTMMEMGYTTMAIAPEINLPQFIAKKYVKQASKFTLKRIHSILKSCMQYDRSIKTGKMTPDIAIEVLMTQVAAG